MPAPWEDPGPGAGAGVCELGPLRGSPRRWGRRGPARAFSPSDRTERQRGAGGGCGAPCRSRPLPRPPPTMHEWPSCGRPAPPAAAAATWARRLVSAGLQGGAGSWRRSKASCHPDCPPGTGRRPPSRPWPGRPAAGSAWPSRPRCQERRVPLMRHLSSPAGCAEKTERSRRGQEFGVRRARLRLRGPGWEQRLGLAGSSLSGDKAVGPSQGWGGGSAPS